MKEQSVIHNTFVIERSYSVSPSQVFAAFANPAMKRHWYGEGDHHDTDTFEMDFRPGGSEHLRYRLNAATPFPGVVIENEGTYLDIVPDSRIVMSSGMTF